MAEKIEVNVSKQLVIEAVDGGLFFLSLVVEGKQTARTAATSGASLLKQVTSMLDLTKQARGPRKNKGEKAAKPATK